MGIEEQPSAESEKLPAWGPGRDLHRLKTDSTASMAELREFVAKMKGRRPQEVMGMVAGSRLIRSMILSTFLCAAVLAVMTVVPYYWVGPRGGTSKTAAAKKAPPAAAAEKPAEEKASPGQSKAAGSEKASGSEKVSPADAEKAIKVMGLGETKVADPKKNPLEDKLDNLLDKVE